MSKPIQIIVGGGGQYDPVPDTTDYNNPNLKGIDGYIENEGFGPWKYSDYQILANGGFRLLNGFKFTQNDVFFFHPTGFLFSTTGGSYTNGFNLSKVLSALFGRVGWMQTTGEDNPTLNATNIVSKGGRFFNDGSFHALITLQNIYRVMELVAATDLNFNTYIEQLQKSVIMRCLNGIFNPPEYICQSLLYDRWGYNDTPIANNNKFIAVRIKVPPVVDLATQIDSVALYFDSDVTFNLYLFNDIKKAPVWIGEVDAVANTQTIVTLEDMVLNYIGDANHGGIFYLGYFQSDLGNAKAIKENDVIFKCNAPYGATMIEATHIGNHEFDKRNIGYSMQSNGLNPHLSVFRDHTWQIVKKASLFDNAIGLQMAAQVVEQIIFNTRSNSSERALKENVDKAIGYMELNGVMPISDSPHTTGLKKQIVQELARMKESFFPKPKATSIRLC
ncbi:MAG: hypothetical protein IPJ81_18050 [Chitinophagaceae bacterium]|nr:hypothetical protein [Chitinophagaceae bacterium]